MFTRNRLELSMMWIAALGALACSAEPEPATRSGGTPVNPTTAAGPSLTPGGDAGSGAAAAGSFSSMPALAGSGAEPPPPPLTRDDGCGAITQQATNERRPADIIIAVDNSGSMDDEIEFVRTQLNAFSQQIVDSGVDVRIILISAALRVPGIDEDDVLDEDSEDDNLGLCIDPPLGSGRCPDDGLAPRYQHVAREVGSNDMLNLFIDTFPQWQAQLRPNATKTFVVVTDDDATDGPNDSADAFETSVAALPFGLFNDWSFSGIYCFSDCPDAAEIGHVYAELVSRRRGVGGDLCEQNFAPVFDALAKSVVQSSGLECAWNIPTPPPGQAFDRQRVNVQVATLGAAPTALAQVPNEGACGTRAGWYYDNPASPTRILACPQSCNQLQGDLNARVDVLFGCETVIAPD
jgi:hypothetical protein